MKRKRGFTLIELLIVITILAILLMTALLSYNKERDKATDAKSKAELNRLKIAFEDYYNDHNCYPPADWFNDANDCGSASLKPYMSQMPCDPRTGKPYVLETDSTKCGWFKLYGELEQIASDPEALELCGVGGSLLGTYGVSSSNTTVTINCDNIPTPTPVPTIPPHTEGPNSCTPQRKCGDYILPYKCGDVPSDPCCKVSFSDSNLAECNSYCAVAPENMLCAR